MGIGLEFERNNIYEGNNFSEGPPDPKRDAQVIRVQFDIVFSLSNKRKVFFRNIYFGTALKSGPVETVPTGLVATALYKDTVYATYNLKELSLKLLTSKYVCTDSWIDMHAHY